MKKFNILLAFILLAITGTMITVFAATTKPATFHGTCPNSHKFVMDKFYIYYEIGNRSGIADIVPSSRYSGILATAKLRDHTGTIELRFDFDHDTVQEIFYNPEFEKISEISYSCSLLRY